MNDEGAIIDGMKVWTGIKLESSVRFEVPNEKIPRDDATSANDNAFGTSTPIN